MEKKVIEVVCEYLGQQHISKRQIEKELQMELSTEKELSASEFLHLCQWIQVKPEYFMAIMTEREKQSYDSV